MDLNVPRQPDAPGQKVSDEDYQQALKLSSTLLQRYKPTGNQALAAVTINNDHGLLETNIKIKFSAIASNRDITAGLICLRDTVALHLTYTNLIKELYVGLSDGEPYLSLSDLSDGEIKNLVDRVNEISPDTIFDVYSKLAAIPYMLFPILGMRDKLYFRNAGETVTYTEDHDIDVYAEALIMTDHPLPARENATESGLVESVRQAAREGCDGRRARFPSDHLAIVRTVNFNHCRDSSQ